MYCHIIFNTFATVGVWNSNIHYIEIEFVIPLKLNTVLCGRFSVCCV